MKAVRSGELRAGAPVSIAVLARQMDLSQTPVREALSLLVGEHLLVEDDRGGFAVRRLDAHDLIGFYRIRMALLTIAFSDIDTQPADHPTRTIGDLMDNLVRTTKDTALVELWSHAQMVLSPYQQAESSVLATLVSAPAILVAPGMARRTQILAWLRRYHRLCERHAIAIAAQALAIGQI